MPAFTDLPHFVCSVRTTTFVTVPFVITRCLLAGWIDALPVYRRPTHTTPHDTVSTTVRLVVASHLHLWLPQPTLPFHHITPVTGCYTFVTTFSTRLPGVTPTALGRFLYDLLYPATYCDWYITGCGYDTRTHTIPVPVGCPSTAFVAVRFGFVGLIHTVTLPTTVIYRTHLVDLCLTIPHHAHNQPCRLFTVVSAYPQRLDAFTPYGFYVPACSSHTAPVAYPLRLAFPFYPIPKHSHNSLVIIPNYPAIPHPGDWTRLTFC